MPLFLLTACITTTVLKNSFQKAPTNPKVFKNRIYFEISSLSQIDTTVIYEEYNSSYFGDKSIKGLVRENYISSDSFYEVYRFYGNGCFSLFHLNKNIKTLTKEMFDPNYTGWRGILYTKENKLTGDLITQVSGVGTIGIIKEIFKFKGDTLFVNEKNNGKHIYIKRKISNEFMNSKAEW